MTEDEFVESIRRMPDNLPYQIEQFERSRQAVMVAAERVFSASVDDILGDLGHQVYTASEFVCEE